MIEFFSALALVFVFEGILPFLAPRAWKKWMLHLSKQKEKSLRMSGFLSMMVGVLLLTVVHQFAN